MSVVVPRASASDCDVGHAEETAGHSALAPQTWHVFEKQSPLGQVAEEQLPAAQVFVDGLQTYPAGQAPPHGTLASTQASVSGSQLCPAGQPETVQSCAGGGESSGEHA